MVRRTFQPALPFARCLGAAVWATFMVTPMARAAEPKQHPALALNWSAPETCPQSEQARQLISEYLGAPVREADTQVSRVVRASVRIVQRGKWQVLLTTELDEERGERELVAATCADAARAAALVLALTIDPAAGERPPQPAPPPPPRVPARPAPPAREPEERNAWSVAAEVLVTAGALPGAAGGLGVTLAAEYEGFAGVLGATIWPPRSQALTGTMNAGGEFSMLTAFLGACRGGRPSPAFHLRGCLIFDVQRLRAEGYGVTYPAAATRSELAPGAMLDWGLALAGPLRLRVPASVSVGLKRPEFYLEELGPVFRSAPLQGRLGLGLELAF